MHSCPLYIGVSPPPPPFPCAQTCASLSQEYTSVTGPPNLLALEVLQLYYTVWAIDQA